jgi:hypothetical protein
VGGEILSDSEKVEGVLIFGIDWATDPRKVGLACGWWQGGSPRVVEMARGDADLPPDAWIVDRIRQHRDCCCLLSLDAPLGWPASFGSALSEHSAGEPIHTQPVNFFRRETDRFIARTIGRRPLDVAADRIARTALSALQLISRISERLGTSIPLVWTPDYPSRVGAVEVYPAGVLQVLELPASRYKDAADRPLRAEILTGLRAYIDLPDDSSAALDDADVLDALVCVLAGADFLAGRAMPPEDPGLALKEGWIWVRRPT